MATTNGFDFKNVIDELVNFARTRTENLGRRPTTSPTQEQLTFAILAALESGAKNAKQIGDSVAVATGGSWVPTSAQVRLGLESLIEQELVEVATKKDRKVYSLTKKGETELTQAAGRFAKAKAGDSMTSGSGPSWLSCDPQFLVAASKLGPVMLDLAQTGSRAQQQRATELLENLRHELHKILAD